MLKLLGMIGIIISCGLIGICQASKLKLRTELLNDYYRMILELKSQINYFKEPLPSIFKKTSKNSLSKAFMMLNEISDEVYTKNHDIAKIWLKNVHKTYEDTPLTKNDLETITYLGEFIGQTDYNNQLQHFEYLEDQLKIQLNEANESLRQKGPMYNKIGFFIGTIIAIMFI